MVYWSSGLCSVAIAAFDVHLDEIHARQFQLRHQLINRGQRNDVGVMFGFKRRGGEGARLRIPSNIMAELSPRNGIMPVAISYRTAPNENKSERDRKSTRLNSSHLGIS